MRRFIMSRSNISDETHDSSQKNEPYGIKFEGVVFNDGKVVIHWLIAKTSISICDSLEDAMTIHGHPEYGSELIFLDSEEVVLNA